jgi:hypothetical protein
MQHLRSRLTPVRVEAVTSAFVAAGEPEGVHDLGRLLENLNNAGLSGDLELRAPAIRPLYSATAQLELGAPLLIRRDDIIFANFEGPHFTRGLASAPFEDLPVLLVAPPFQLQGIVSVSRGADPTPALRTIARGFFIVRDARVFDTDGAPLGDGEQIVVNGRIVQALSATTKHIESRRAQPGFESRMRPEIVPPSGERAGGDAGATRAA